MANNPITTPLPADLPTDWVYGQTIGPNGTDVGLSQQHGYNYLMQQVNAAQQAAEEIGEAFSGLPSLGSDGKIPKSQIPDLTAEDVGAVPMDEVGKPGGVASLDNNGVVPGDQMPGYTQVSSNTAMGQSSYGGPLSVSNIQGNTVLGGTPAYDAPVSMESVKGPLKLHISGKNLIDFSKATKTGTTSGVSYSISDDGAISLSGVCDRPGSSAYIMPFGSGISQATYLPAGSYYLSGLNTDYSASKAVYLYLNCYNGAGEAIVEPKPAVYGPAGVGFTLPEGGAWVTVNAAVKDGTDVDGVTITPQIEVGSEFTDYEEPSNTTVEIPLKGTDGQELEPLRMAYGGNSSAKTAYYDRIVRRDGVWHVQRNVAAKNLTSAAWLTGSRYATPTFGGYALTDGAESYIPMCTHFAPRAYASNGQDTGIWFGSRLVVGNQVLPNGAQTTAEELKSFCAAQAEAGTPVTVIYALKNPVYEELHQDVQVLLNTISVPGGTCSVWFEGDILPSADIGLPRGDFPCADVTGAYLLLNQHMQNQDNPHGVTAEQVGADAAGSAATVQTNLTNHINNKSNPHGVTPGQIGAIPSSGGSVSGPLNFANSAWNNVGDDAAFGDRNVAGNFCVKGLNGAPGITLFTSDESQSYQVFGQHNLSLLMSQLSANSVCRIASGSYVGVNTEEYNGPAKVFQLPFVPKAMIIVLRLNEESVSDINSGPKLWIAISGATYVAPTYSSGNQKGCAGFVWNGTTVTVNGYNSKYPNWNGVTYDWIALG